MPDRLNQYGQPVGPDVPDWNGAKRPEHTLLTGRYCRLEALNTGHAKDLYNAFATDSGGLWTYMPVGPFDTLAAMTDFVETAAISTDPQFYAITDSSTGQATGIASYLRITPEQGTIEVGFIALSPLLQRSRAATEAMFLMMQHAFDLGYRRYEWKCDALNARSQQAAKRFGFVFDGVFRQAMVYKGRNRDTAWFSILDQDWPRIKAGFQSWLAPGNFDADGHQKTRLSLRGHGVSQKT